MPGPGALKTGEARVNRLVDIIAEEVSDVDRAANRRRYLVIKRRRDMAGIEEQTPPTPDPGLVPVVKATKLGDFLRAKVDSGETTVAALAEAAGITEGTVRQILEGSIKRPPEERLRGLARAAKAPFEELRRLADAGQDGSAAAAKSGDTPPAPDTSREENVAKAGARFSLRRRSQLRSAIELLQKLLAEVVPTAAGSPARQTAAQPAPAPTAKAAPPADNGDLAALMKSVSKELAQLRSRLREQNAEIGRLRKSTGLPASREVEASAPARPPADINWPMDMNRPLTRDQVEKDVSFFD